MRVQVYAYDLTRGISAALSPMLLGYQVEAVWHTGVVIDGRTEIFFGYGINRARAGTTMFGSPARVLEIGTSEVTPELLEELLADLAPRFRPQDYNLLFHNCNHFSNELVQLLTGESLPDYIMDQAQHLFNTPWGESLMPMIMAMEGFTANATASPAAQQAGAPALQQPQQQQQQQQPAAQQRQAAAPAAPAAAAAVPGGGAAAVNGSSAAAPGESAAAHAGMAAVARAAKQAGQAEAGGHSAGSGSSAAPAAAEAAPAPDTRDDGAAAAAGKAAEAVAALHLTADSRAASSSREGDAASEPSRA